MDRSPTGGFFPGYQMPIFLNSENVPPPPPLSELVEYINPEIHTVHPALRQGTHVLSASARKPPRPDSYKTVMCQAWLESTRCAFGADCKFAHGESELRPAKLPVRNSLKYKTKLCDKYTTTGICPYGSRCLFIHPDSRSSAYYRQSAIVQQLVRQSIGTQTANAAALDAEMLSMPSSGFKTHSNAPSPPPSAPLTPTSSRPHPSWPLESPGFYTRRNSKIESQSLPNSRHSSISSVYVSGCFL